MKSNEQAVHGNRRSRCSCRRLLARRCHHFDVLQEMGPSEIRKLYDVALIVIMVAVPFVVLIYPQVPPGFFSLRRRMLIACLGGWILIIVHQYFNQSFNKRHPQAGDLGDLGDGLVFFLGWLFMILGSIPSLAICAIDDYRRKHGHSGVIKPFKNTLAEQAGRGDGDKPPN